MRCCAHEQEFVDWLKAVKQLVCSFVAPSDHNVDDINWGYLSLSGNRP